MAHGGLLTNKIQNLLLLRERIDERRNTISNTQRSVAHLLATQRARKTSRDTRRTLAVRGVAFGVVDLVERHDVRSTTALGRISGALLRTLGIIELVGVGEVRGHTAETLTGCGRQSVVGYREDTMMYTFQS